MMTQVSVRSCLKLVGITFMMPTIIGNIVNTARQSIFSHLISDHDTFTTISVSSLQECGKLCETVTSCVLINYWSRGRICKLEHVLGKGEYSVVEEQNDGYISWRNKLFDVAADITNLCPNCNKKQSCLVQAGVGECVPFACGKPHQYGTINLWGNINTVGGKFIYGCYSHTEDRYYSQNFDCSMGGLWSGIDDICGYEDYEIDDTPVKLKIVDQKVNKTEAKQKCENEGANVTNILTWKKLKFFKGMSDKIPGEFWIDMERVGDHYTLWRTSSGQEQQIDTNLWIEYTNVMGGQNCACIYVRKNWHLNDVQCWLQYYYICEMMKN